MQSVTESRDINWKTAFHTLCNHIKAEVERNGRIPYEAAAYRAEEAKNIYAYAEGIVESAGFELPDLAER